MNFIIENVKKEDGTMTQDVNETLVRILEVDDVEQEDDESQVVRRFETKQEVTRGN